MNLEFLEKKEEKLTPDQIHKLATDPLPCIDIINPIMPIGHTTNINGPIKTDDEYSIKVAGLYI